MTMRLTQRALRALVVINNERLSSSIPSAAIGDLLSLYVLAFSMNRISGTLPAAIGCLKELRAIQATDNELSGRLPQALVELVQLRWLLISNNYISGKIPGLALFAGSDGRLQRLWLGNNWLQGSLPENLACLQLIQEFAAEENRITGRMPESLGSMKAAEMLSLSTSDLRGSLPDALACLLSLRRLEVEDNQLEGSLPQELQQMRSLRVFFAAHNSITGSIPGGLLCLRDLRRLAVGKNKLCGQLDEVLLALRALISLTARDNKLVGSLPDTLGYLLQLQLLSASGNSEIRGQIPDHIGVLRELILFYLDKAKLAGTLPDGLFMSMQHSEEEGLILEYNRLAGSLPDCVGYIAKMTGISVAFNLLCGTLPLHIGRLQAVKELRLSGNTLAGSLPDAIRFMSASLKWLSLFKNDLSGALPEGLEDLPGLRVLSVDINRLRGALPHSLWALSYLSVYGNWLTGTLPMTLGSGLSVLFIDETAISGTLPMRICSMRSLEWFGCGKSNVEGTIPPCLGGATTLAILNMMGEARRRPKLHGLVPPSLVRGHALRCVCAQENSLRGEIPAMPSTFRLLAFSNNDLQLLQGLHARNSSAILLYRNRLSCELPRDNRTVHVQMALVAVGNHFEAPDKDPFPAWVLPFEREGLFWFDRRAGRWFSLKFVSGSAIFLLAFLRSMGVREYLVALKDWQATADVGQRAIARTIASTTASMPLTALGSCFLLMQLPSCDYYRCPNTLTWASACISRSSIVHVLVVLLCGSFSAQAQKAWWTQRSRRRSSSRGRPVWKQWLCWAVWLLVVLLMALLVTVSIASKCVPSFLSLKGLWVLVLSLICGLCQAVISGIVTPLLAKKAVGARKGTVVSVANLLTGWIIPACVVLLLDGSCLDHWTSWWKQCDVHHGHAFNMDADLTADQDEVRKRILDERDVCSPRGLRSPAACARGIALKLQEVLLSKLTTAAFAIPSGRLMTKQWYKDSDEFVVKIGLLIQLGMLVGGCLPLVALLLCVSALSEGLLAVAAWRNNSFNSVSRAGDVRAAMALASLCSLLFYCGFIFEDSAGAVSLALLLPRWLAVSFRLLLHKLLKEGKRDSHKWREADS